VFGDSGEQEELEQDIDTHFYNIFNIKTQRCNISTDGRYVSNNFSLLIMTNYVVVDSGEKFLMSRPASKDWSFFRFLMFRRFPTRPTG